MKNPSARSPSLTVAPHTDRRTSPRRLWGVCLLSFCLLLSVGWISLDVLFGSIPYHLSALFSRADTHSELSETVTIPSLVGQTFTSAGLTDPDLFFPQVTYVWADTPPLLILDQQPPAGAKRRVTRGSNPCTVRLTVSLGKQTLTVPSLVGADAREAEISLRDNGFSVVTVRQTNADAENVSRETYKRTAHPQPGTVLYTDPPAGTEIEPGDTVRLIVYDVPSPASVLCPDLTGLSRQEAVALLASLDLRIGQIDEKSAPDTPPGTVLAQNYLPDTWIRPGTPVSLTVASPTPEPNPTDRQFGSFWDFFRRNRTPSGT